MPSRPFIDDMPSRTKADLVGVVQGRYRTELARWSRVLCRFLSTLAPARNAEFMAAKGAAIHLPQTELTAPTLATLLRSLTRDRLLAIAQAARSVGRPDATAVVASVIERVAA